MDLSGGSSIQGHNQKPIALRTLGGARVASSLLVALGVAVEETEGPSDDRYDWVWQGRRRELSQV